MSTILDALRKLQGDRDGLAPVPRRDLRASVLDGGLPPVRPERRPEPKVRPLVAALGGGVAVAASIGMFLLWSGPEVSSFEPSASVPEIPEEFPPLAQIPTPPTPPTPPEPVTRAPEPLVNLAAPPETPPESIEARYAAFQPPPPQQPAVEREYAGMNDDEPFQEPPQRKTFVPSSKRARPRTDTASLPQAQQGFTPSTTPVPNYEGPQIVTRAEPNAAPQPVELESADMNRARERLAQSEARTAQRARREPREAVENEPPTREETAQPAAVVGVEFPVLEVQSVLWHPDPQRRSATVLLDGQLATDAREGDLIGGVLVDRITPGSVEFRMGQERKRVDMAP